MADSDFTPAPSQSSGTKQTLDNGFDFSAGYLTAYEDVIAGKEAGYANNPKDSGGETWDGIARRWHPDWSGWLIVDAAKVQGFIGQSLNNELRGNARLGELVKQFYADEYWAKISGDGLASASQLVAIVTFDIEVNAVEKLSDQCLQRSLNALNKFKHGRRQWGADLVVDGKIGPATVSRLQIAERTDHRYMKAVAIQMACLQGVNYEWLSAKNPEKYREFTLGWLHHRLGRTFELIAKYEE